MPARSTLTRHPQDRPPTETSHRRASTVLELLVAVAILLFIATIVYPALARANWQAQRTVAASNLRQIVASINIYAANNDLALPDHRTLAQLAPASLFRDPRNPWPATITLIDRSPNVGSFAYIPDPLFEEKGPTLPVLASLAESSHIPPPSEDPVCDYETMLTNLKCLLIDKVLITRRDGSVSNCKFKLYFDDELGRWGTGFSWEWIFANQYALRLTLKHDTHAIEGNREKNRRL